MIKTDVIEKEKILEQLNNKQTNIILLETVDSTNLYLKKIAENSPEYTVVIAENQTSGRGRFDRKFYSPQSSGIYISILLKPAEALKTAVLVTCVAAVAVADAVSELTGKQPKIKWVNDVLINSKKVCGILCEGVINSKTNTLDRVILGIGINAYTPQVGFADEIKEIAGAVFDEVTQGNRNRLISAVLNKFEVYYRDIESKIFLEKYRSYSAVLGREILVLKNNDSTPATALEIDNDCRLLVEYADGRHEYLSSGEISIKIK